MRFNIWECEKRPLPEILSHIVDNRGKTVPTSSDGHILIATNCVRNENLYPTYEKVRYLTEETYQTWFRSHPKPGDILFVCKGTPGRVCMVPDPIDFCIAQDMVALRVNENIVYNRYLLAVLRSSVIQNQIEQTSVGDVIPHFKKSFFDQLLIPIPSMEIQKIIGDYYFAFSNKIELNKTINNNLADQAITLFKQYYDQATDEVCFTDLIQILGGGTPKTSCEAYWNGEIPFFTPKDVGNPYVLATEKYITENGLSNCNSRLYPINTVFVTARGTVGKISMPGIPMAMNQSCYALVGKNIPQLLVYFYTLQTVAKLKHKAMGAVFDAITTRDFETEQVRKLDNSAVNDFVNIVDPIYRQILSLTIENQRLVALRDTLLPKFMAGELDVTEVEL